jgi:hypothetical protein
MMNEVFNVLYPEDIPDYGIKMKINEVPIHSSHLLILLNTHPLILTLDRRLDLPSLLLNHYISSLRLSEISLHRHQLASLL